MIGPLLTTLPQRGDVPDILFPTDNQWGIPVLAPAGQADFAAAPLLKWGRDRKARNVGGTWHFYTDDYKYLSLWTDPTPLLRTGCRAIIEPNFSCYSQTPPAVALAAIFAKRWLACYWQRHGIQVWVDLNVAPEHKEINLLGVPRTWRSFATRAYADRPGQVLDEWLHAAQYTGSSDLQFLVYGGGSITKALCQKNHWLWIPDDMKADWKAGAADG